MAKHNVSSDMYSRQHILANCPRILSGLEICFVILDAGYGNGLINTYGGTVLLLASNPLLMHGMVLSTSRHFSA